MSHSVEVCPPAIDAPSASKLQVAGASLQTLRVRTGAEKVGITFNRNNLTIDVPMPHLSGPFEEVVGTGEGWRQGRDFYIFKNSGGCYGIALGRSGEPPHEAARILYTALLRETKNLHLHRIWNWIPNINKTVDGEENYQAFNAGRHAAFTERYGLHDLRPHLPAASALGIKGDRMAVVFAAGNDEPEYFENPEQVPACDYPPQYGRLPPAFARGTRVKHADGTREWFLSGTASIKGHATIGDSFNEQMALTLDNVRLMRRHMGVPDRAEARWKVFLRHPENLAACQKAFSSVYPGDTASTLYLHSDICRACLLVEVEGTFSVTS